MTAIALGLFADVSYARHSVLGRSVGAGCGGKRGVSAPTSLSSTGLLCTTYQVQRADPPFFFGCSRRVRAAFLEERVAEVVFERLAKAAEAARV